MIALPGSFLLLGLIALVDVWTGPHLCFTYFYLIPVVACAWWSGLSSGILLSLAATAAWHTVDAFENPIKPPAMMAWNGITLFCTLTLVVSLVSRLRAGMLRERRLARTDALTGAANARTFFETAEDEALRARRTMRPLTIAYLDLDNFKQLNDTLGHAAGDAALVDVVVVIQAGLRNSDLLARLGGDEFALLLPETDPDGAVAMLERMQEAVLADMARNNRPLTLSVGAVTFLRPEAGVDYMIRRVDALMYAAKRKGKGRMEYLIVEDGRSWPEEREVPERRATTRILCHCMARIRREADQETEEQFATVHNMSTEGIGIQVDIRLPQGTLLVVEPLARDARTLLARVLRTELREGKWEHGCVLAVRLAPEELDAWVGNSQLPA